MNKKLRKIKEVWKSYEDYFAKEKLTIQPGKIDSLLNHVFCPGPFYFYIMDFPSMRLTYVHPDIEDILGIDAEQATLERLAERVHPGDAEHIIRCEEVAQRFLFSNISPDDIKRYKVTYCYRFKNKLGEYQLFLHQAIALSLDKNQRVGKVLGVHSNISHITAENNYQLSFIGIEGRPNYIGIDLNNRNVKKLKQKQGPLSKRELEIVTLLAEGWTSKEVAESLFLSPDTIRTHRNNIRKKLGVKNTTQMVVACIRAGLI